MTIAVVVLLGDNHAMNTEHQIEPIFTNDGYRPNVGIVIVNNHKQVFWARRVTGDGWQFPQGGVHHDETVVDSMYRELEEETGLLATDVELVARTANWLKYDLPSQYLWTNEKRSQSSFRGQKQLWFLLKLLNDSVTPNFEMNDSPEFDDWRWIEYWDAVEQVVDFKREVYKHALTELEVYLS